MKKLRMILLVILLFGLFLSAYIGRIPAMVKIDAGDAGKTIQLSAGDTLEVSLEGNPSTGYTWEIVSGLDLLEQEVEPEFSAASQQVVGSSGIVRFEFKPVSTGETVLELVYLRPFERDLDPLQTFSVNLVVK
jgi:inhibitor of cysteine peptidase